MTHVHSSPPDLSLFDRRSGTAPHKDRACQPLGSMSETFSCTSPHPRHRWQEGGAFGPRPSPPYRSTEVRVVRYANAPLRPHPMIDSSRGEEGGGSCSPRGDCIAGFPVMIDEMRGSGHEMWGCGGETRWHLQMVDRIRWWQTSCAFGSPIIASVTLARSSLFGHQANAQRDLRKIATAPR